MDKRNKKRIITQVLAALLTNANLPGFFKGKIYHGKLKTVCIPGLNCYSCPGAVGACPIGAMQAVLGSRKYNFAFYVVGFLSLLGVLFGRFICGWLCVFGLIQDLLYKIPTPKLKVNQKLDHVLRYLKYVVLAVFVLLLPTFLVDEFGISPPYFCKYVCPVGTLEGGIQLVLLNKSLQSTIGLLFGWKFFLMASILISSIFIYRPFCKYICPLGAFYALFNKISFIKIHVDADKCTSCGLCAKKCKMGINVQKTPNNTECIRCGDCMNACPQKALHMDFLQTDKSVAVKRNNPVNVSSGFAEEDRD
ncbi:MAG: 4Fe-4S binding protein [Pseudoflavonifractor sp.]|nr:4Fe-4S binding protein [Pseudoflavonifractor sp.]